MPHWPLLSEDQLLCSLVEGEELADFMAAALEKVKGNNLLPTVAPMIKKLLQVCTCILQ